VKPSPEEKFLLPRIPRGKRRKKGEKVPGTSTHWFRRKKTRSTRFELERDRPDGRRIRGEKGKRERKALKASGAQ